MGSQKISTGGCLIVDDKVLVVRRSPKESFLTGWFELPGGGVEFGESPQDAVIREFFEETNIRVSIVDIIRVFSYVSDDNSKHTVEIVFLVKALSNVSDIRLSEEHDDFRWISLDELNNLKISEEIKKNILAGFERTKKS
ncbi:hypothetical protein DRJ22_03230 [Candidatus Woesearchaeota archaeon]|nr:MAG: hypothetical protein DRJ22_03230 [Candidatus Woesearchaeota archaeon]